MRVRVRLFPDGNNVTLALWTLELSGRRDRISYWPALVARMG